MALGIFSVLVALEKLCGHLSVLKSVMIENVKIMIFSALKSKFYQYSVLTKTYSNDLSHFLPNLGAGIFQIESRKPHQLKASLALIEALKIGPVLLFSKI